MTLNYRIGSADGRRQNRLIRAASWPNTRGWWQMPHMEPSRTGSAPPQIDSQSDRLSFGPDLEECPTLRDHRGPIKLNTIQKEHRVRYNGGSTLPTDSWASAPDSKTVPSSRCA